VEYVKRKREKKGKRENSQTEPTTKDGSQANGIVCISNVLAGGPKEEELRPPAGTLDRLPLVSSSSNVVLDESVDSFTCDPSPFFAIIDRPRERGQRDGELFTVRRFQHGHSYGN